MSVAENRLEVLLADGGFPDWEREYRFARDIVGHGAGIRHRLKELGLKDWRFDFAWPDVKLAVEIEGGGWIGGRHTTGAGFESDLRKYDAGMRAGWTIYRCSPAMVNDGSALETIDRLLSACEAQ